MTRVLSTLIILALILGGFLLFYPRNQPTVTTNNIAVNDKDSWHEFTAPQGKFIIKFPTLPHHAVENVEDPATHEKRLYDFFLSSKNDGTIYAVNTITFPPKNPSPYNEAFLRDFIQQMLAGNPLNKIKSLEMKPFRKGQALDFKVENAEVTIDGKAFFDDNTLYILSTTARNDHHDGQEYELFLDSFQLPSKAK